MQLHVAFLPALTVRPQVSIVVDVIRASTSLVTLVERGAAPIFIAADVETARRHAAGTNAILAGEEGGLAPLGFDFGNSPVELSQAELRGKAVVFVTTNGTAAIRAVQGGSAVFVGALRNGTAVSREAVALARDQRADLTIVCAGRVGAFGLDDAYCAGYLVDRVLREVTPACTDAADAALRIYRGESDPLGLFRSTAAGRAVIELGLSADLAYCVATDVSTVVPLVGREVLMAAT